MDTPTLWTPSEKDGPCKPKRSGRFFWFPILIAFIVALSVANKAKSEPFPQNAPRFDVTVTGQGPDVILIPGLGCSGAVWDDTVNALKATHRVHVVTLSGIAGTPVGANTSGEISNATVEALHQYALNQHLDHPTIVGHSYGGFLAVKWAAAYGDDTNRIVVVDALPFFGVLMGATPQTIDPQATRMRDAIVGMDDATFTAMQKSGAARLVSAPYIDRVVGWTVASNRAVFAQMMFEDMTTDLTPLLPTIRPEVVVYVPTTPQSPYSPEATEAFYQSLYAGTPKLKTRRIDNSLHFIMFDQPAAFLEALKKDL